MGSKERLEEEVTKKLKEATEIGGGKPEFILIEFEDDFFVEGILIDENIARVRFFVRTTTWEDMSHPWHTIKRVIRMSHDDFIQATVMRILEKDEDKLTESEHQYAICSSEMVDT